MTFPDWRQWYQVTPGPVRSEGHSGNWVGIYVNNLARDTYLATSAPYPECAAVVKPIYTDQSAKIIRKITVMVKMREGYDTANSNWWYGVYNAEGTIGKRHGKLMDCILCHNQAAETDYLFSKEVSRNETGD